LENGITFGQFAQSSNLSLLAPFRYFSFLVILPAVPHQAAAHAISQSRPTPLTLLTLRGPGKVLTLSTEKE
jgi:hypothetical protein